MRVTCRHPSSRSTSNAPRCPARRAHCQARQDTFARTVSDFDHEAKRRSSLWPHPVTAGCGEVVTLDLEAPSTSSSIRSSPRPTTSNALSTALTERGRATGRGCRVRGGQRRRRLDVLLRGDERLGARSHHQHVAQVPDVGHPSPRAELGTFSFYAGEQRARDCLHGRPLAAHGIKFPGRGGARRLARISAGRSSAPAGAGAALRFASGKYGSLAR